MTTGEAAPRKVAPARVAAAPAGDVGGDGAGQHDPAAPVPRSAAAARPDDVTVLELADPAARHPISLVHRHPEPTAPSARAFLALLATFKKPPAARRDSGL
jgi:hypothetical protein